MKPARAKLVILFLAAAGLLAASGVLSYWVGLATLNAQQQTATELAIVQHLEDNLATLTEAETGQRGYLLTGDENYLAPYNQALKEFGGGMDELHKLVQSGELPANRIQDLDSLSRRKLEELAETIRLRREQGIGAALNLVNTNHGKKTMDQIRAVTGELISARNQMLAQATEHARLVSIRRTFTFIALGLLNLSFLAWAFRRVHVEMEQRELTRLEATHQKQVLSTTLASIGDGVTVVDPQGRVNFLNSEAERLTGWKNDEARGKPLPEVFCIVNEQTRRSVENPVDKVLRLGTVVGLANHTLLLSKDGRETPIDDSAAPIREADGELHGVVLVFRDFTERRQLEESKSRLAAIIETSDDAIMSKSLEGIITTWNSGAQRLFGYAPGEIVGQSVQRLVPPEHHADEVDILSRLRRGEPIKHYETVRIAKDGRRVHVSLSISPILNSYGEIIGASNISRDITERRQADDALRATKEALAAANASLEATVRERTARLREMIGELEHFSYAIVHDMRAPLRAMQGFGHMLETEGEQFSADERRNLAHRIVTASNRLDQLIQDALNYNRAVLQEMPMHTVALGPLVNGLLETYPNLQPANADIHIEGALPVVHGNEALLTQCFSNLLGNAVKFVAPGVRPKIRVWAEPAGDMVQISVQDNGIGIPVPAQPRLFGMFQKLNHDYEGTGVGLAIVRKVVERMLGKVGVESQPGHGSRFWVQLQPVRNNVGAGVPLGGALAST